ncbi:MAG: DUF2116 family Zn-ribbon domain-containing protein [Candidatus Bathyarchaeia archaeon]
MVEKHRHCVVCGISVPADKDPPICSQRCELEIDKRKKRQRYTMLMTLIPMVVVAVLIVLLPYLFPPTVGPTP